LVLTEAQGAALRLRNLSVMLGDRTLIAGANVAIMPREKVLVTPALLVEKSRRPRPEW
jgi:hypothetical protein